MEEQKQETTLDNTPLITDSAEDYKILTVAEQGRRYKTTFTKKFENRVPWTPPNPEEVKSFIPGTIHKLSVHAGDYVRKNDELLVFEAMKMYNVIRAPYNGIVHKVLVKEGDRLPKGVVILTVHPTNETPKSMKRKAKNEKRKARNVKRKAKSVKRKT
ncbi:MAG: acetyl-CoA carboxylase biotin carboxyl carrier protein subunit [Prevotellaceae bacterium]|jgi:biotin carboxyl carrier protein|nr:acetyl-CoA carboxylase biotin carboxyl carrier protein subunit [Prevotellaceae bacterium]